MGNIDITKKINDWECEIVNGMIYLYFLQTLKLSPLLKRIINKFFIEKALDLSP